MEEKPRLTIHDIAEIAGVSKSTVSRVINQNPNVSAKKREAILKIIQQYDFVPNENARTLGAGLNRSIGIFVGNIENQYYSEILKGAEDAAAKLDYFPLICFATNPRREAFYTEEMIQRRTSGVIVVSSSITNPELVERLSNVATIVAIQSDIPCSLRIDSANEQGIYRMTQHLIMLGHRRLAYLSSLPSSAVLESRLKGFRRGCEEKGILPDESYLVRATEDQQEMAGLVQRLFQREKPPTAIVCCNDYCAAVAYNTAREMGIRIPRELSITGYDNLPLSTVMEPKLTTVEQPIRKMGYTAVERLVQYLQNPQESRETQDIVFPSEIILRQSSAPPQPE